MNRFGGTFFNFFMVIGIVTSREENHQNNHDSLNDMSVQVHCLYRHGWDPGKKRLWLRISLSRKFRGKSQFFVE
jgi:hypothetical protein